MTHDDWMRLLFLSGGRAHHREVPIAAVALLDRKGDMPVSMRWMGNVDGKFVPTETRIVALGGELGNQGQK